jgi:hypothetical protein
MSTAIAKNFQVGTSGTPADNFTIFQPATPDGTLRIGNGNTGITTGLVTLNSAGNLGLGTAPSAWASGWKVMQLGTVSSFADTGTATRVTSNGFVNSGGTNVYLTSAAATTYIQSAGQHLWYNAPSGTAGNAISFTQAMTLDASGNLGIGTSSPTSKLDVFQDQNAASNLRIRNNDSGSSAYASVVVNASGNSWGMRMGSSAANSNALQFVLDALGTPSVKATIDSSGNLLVGTTSSSGKLTVAQTVNDTFSATFQNAQAASGAGYGVRSQITNWSPNNTGNFFFYGVDSSAVRFEVRANGGIANYQGNDANLSDGREKTNFAPAKSYLETICAIPVQTFNYIDQNMEEDPGTTLGVVAQDVQAVAPELVMESNWGTKEDPKMRLSIYQTDLQYALMKALQELKAEFDAYKASHP